MFILIGLLTLFSFTLKTDLPEFNWWDFKGNTVMDTGWQEFTVAATTAAGGTTDWTNKNNALTNIGNAATSDVPEGDYSYRLDVVNASAGLAGVSGTVDGVELEVSVTGYDASSKEIQDSLVKLITGTVPSGTNKARNTQIGDSAIETIVYGGPTDTWGLTLNPATVQSTDFGAALQYYSAGGSGPALASVYRVRVKVYYTPAAAPSQNFLPFYN